MTVTPEYSRAHAQDFMYAGARRSGRATETLHILAGDVVRNMYAVAGGRGLSVNRNQLLEETARFVQRISDVADETAQTIAGRAIGEYESWGRSVSFDLANSTPHTVFLRDARSARAHIVTAVELAQLLAHHDGNLI